MNAVHAGLLQTKTPARPFVVRLQCGGKVDFWCCHVVLVSLCRSKITYPKFECQKRWNISSKLPFSKNDIEQCRLMYIPDMNRSQMRSTSESFSVYTFLCTDCWQASRTRMNIKNCIWRSERRTASANVYLRYESQPDALYLSIVLSTYFPLHWLLTG